MAMDQSCASSYVRSLGLSGELRQLSVFGNTVYKSIFSLSYRLPPGLEPRTYLPVQLIIEMRKRTMIPVVLDLDAREHGIHLPVERVSSPELIALPRQLDRLDVVVVVVRVEDVVHETADCARRALPTMARDRFGGWKC